MYKRSYTTSDILTRYEIFKDNVNYILKHNRNSTSTVLGTTKFLDMSSEEFKKRLSLGRYRNIHPHIHRLNDAETLNERKKLLNELFPNTKRHNKIKHK